MNTIFLTATVLLIFVPKAAAYFSLLKSPPPRSTRVVPKKPSCPRSSIYNDRAKLSLVTPHKDKNFLSYSCNIVTKSLTTYTSSADKLNEIPKDIPSNVTQVQLSDKCLQSIPADAFKHLLNCEKLDLSVNIIKSISKSAFRGLVKLECLDLKRNSIAFIAPEAFTALSSLQILYLTSNELGNLRRGVLNGLKSLQILKLDLNSLQSFRIENGAFDGLSALQHLDLSRNKLNEIFAEEPVNFEQLSALRSLELQNNIIREIEPGSFDSLKYIEFLNLGYNIVFKGNQSIFRKLTGLKHLFLTRIRLSFKNDTFKNFTQLIHLDLSRTSLYQIHGDFFKGLASLQKLNLSSNRIAEIKREHFTHIKALTELDLSSNAKRWHAVKIENGAFQDLKKLKKLYLSNNELTQINKGMLEGLHELQMLDLNNHKIRFVEPGSFANIVLSNAAIKLDHASLTTWDRFTDDRWLNRSQVFKPYFWKIILMFHVTGMDSSWSKFTSKRHFCWMINARDKGWLQLETYCRSRRCTIHPAGCPETDHCMEYDEAKCQVVCKEGSLSELIRDYEVCPFQYLCNCTCPVFEENSCEAECAEKGQFPATRFTESGCKTCSCVCPKVNCAQKCFDHEFHIFNNTFGCPECSCICPEINCNEKCNGTGLGIPGPVDEAGCSTTCAGCIFVQNNNTDIEIRAVSKNTNNVIFLVTAFLVILVFASAVCAFLLRRRFISHNQQEVQEDESELNYLLSKLNDDLGKQVEECWIEPINLRIGHLLGNGNFGIVWSGRLSEGPVKETEVAIKKIKGTYKDGYEGKLQLRKGNDFDIFVDKIRVEVEIENQKIDDFLQEAVIMRKFNHPNVLSLIGISTHGDRPCAILPLMTNGDLKKYLTKNQCMNSVKDLLVFSLGVAEGMEHIAELQFVHRDLAARNCMLDSDLVVKIADFGLTRNLQEEDCYQVENKRRALPVRWMSLEALEEGVFALKNDVWSFGILLWEIFTYGGHPYVGIDNEDILHYLKTGKRLQQPEICPDFIYEMMTECWSENPEKRPTFTDLRIRLNDFADSEAEYMKMPDDA